MTNGFDLRASLRLYLIADPEQTTGDYLPAVERAIAGGVTAVQIRAKSMPDGEFLNLAQTVKGICDVHAVPIFVNDRVDIAFAIDADGVHVGVNDLPVETIRRFTGGRKLIGYSPATDEQLADAASSGADYVGLGPVYPTGSKDDAGAAIGLDTIRRRTSHGLLPSVGIGGITAANAGDVIDAGADGVAVISAILRGSDPERRAAELRQVVDRALAARTRNG
ncbi:MAG: thiamine phosphate synthase [Thermomicrobiales bacterium]